MHFDSNPPVGTRPGTFPRHWEHSVGMSLLPSQAKTNQLVLPMTVFTFQRILLLYQLRRTPVGRLYGASLETGLVLLGYCLMIPRPRVGRPFGVGSMPWEGNKLIPTLCSQCRGNVPGLVPTGGLESRCKPHCGPQCCISLPSRSFSPHGEGGAEIVNPVDRPGGHFV